MAQNWHNEYADRKNGRKPVDYPHPDLEEILAPDVRADDLPGAADARRAAARGLLARGGRQPPQGDRQEDPRAHREGAHQVRRRLRRAGSRPGVRREDLRHDRAVRRLLVQQVALGRLRLPRVPDRLSEGELPGRVPRRAAHEREEQQGPDRGLPQRVPPAATSRCSSPTSTSPSRTSPSAPTPTAASAHPLRALGSAQRREGVVALIVRRARARAVRSPTSTTSATGSIPTALNKRTVESLTKAGGFDSLGHPRQGLVDVHEQIVEDAVARRRRRDAGQLQPLRPRGERDSVPGDGYRAPAHRRSPTTEYAEVAAARVREGDARPLRERPPAARRGARAQPPRRRAPLSELQEKPGRRGARGRRHRHRA